eukprot:scaffold113829_cov30-Tisochrysis_lutea.AAC.5
MRPLETLSTNPDRTLCSLPWAGQLGLPSPPEHASQPVRLASHCKDPLQVVSCGRAHTIFLSVAGVLRGCGARRCLCGPAALASMGQSTSGPYTTDGTADFQYIPADLRGGGGGAIDVVRAVACGGDHTLVVTPEGQLFSFGEGGSGQLGRPAGGSSAGRALRVGGPLVSRNVIAVWCSVRRLRWGGVMPMVL